MGIFSKIGDFVGDVAGGVGDIFGEITGAAGVERQAGRSARDILRAQREAYGEARDILSPYMEEARTAREQLMVEMGLAPGEAGAYMQTPGYQALLEERRGEAEQAAAGTGTLYSGRRIQTAADIGGRVQSQYYQNYMNLLQNIGSPSVATNVASLRMGQVPAQQAASGYMMEGAAAKQAAIADIMTGASNVASGAFSGGYI